MKNYLFILCLYISINALSQNTANSDYILGEWNYYKGYFDYSIVFKSDSTFKYRQVGDMVDRFSEGTWFQKKNNIYISSYIQSEYSSCVRFDKDSLLEGYKFVLKDNHNQIIEFISIKSKDMLNNIDTLMFSTEGIFFLNNIKLGNIDINIVGYRNLNLQIEDSKNIFEIVMVPTNLDYVIFKDEKWKIKNNKIYTPLTVRDNNIYSLIKDRKDYFMKNTSREEFYMKK